MWLNVTNEELERIVNPIAIFLENCNDVLEGVCTLDDSHFALSGSFTGHTAMAEMLSI